MIERLARFAGLDRVAARSELVDLDPPVGNIWPDRVRRDEMEGLHCFDCLLVPVLCQENSSQQRIGVVQAQGA